MIIWDNLKIQNNNYTTILAPSSNGLAVQRNGGYAALEASLLSGSSFKLSSNSKYVTWNDSAGLKVGSLSEFSGLAKFTQGIEITGQGATITGDLEIDNGDITVSDGSITVATFISGNDLFLDEDAEIRKDLRVYGTASFSGNITLQPGVVLDGPEATIAARYNNRAPKCYPGVILSEAHNDDMYILPVLPPSSVSSAKMYISWKHRDGTTCTCTVSPSTDSRRPWISLAFDHQYDNTGAVDNYICHIDSIKINSTQADRTITITYNGVTKTFVRSNTDWNLDTNTIGYCLQLNRNPWYPDSTSAGRWFADQDRSFTIIAPNKAWASGQGDDAAARRICYFMRGLMTLCGIQYFDSADVYYAHGSNSATRLFHKQQSTASTHLTLRCDQVDNAMCQGTVMELFV